MARFQILSLIGGGIRGAFVTSLLYELEQKLGRPIAESFDLIAGTSTGAIIAAGLASGMSAEQMHDFYRRYGEQIFTPRPPYKARGVLRVIFPVADWIFRRRTGGGLDAAFRARFCPIALKQAFDEGFGDRTLGDVDFTRLIIPSVNLTRGQPHVFRSCHLPKGVYDRDVRIADVIVAATAAPTYFPHKEINQEAYIDGGVWANDPSVLGVAEAMRVKELDRATQAGEDGHVHIEDLSLLSIGTGTSEYSLAPPGADAGLLYWAPNVADVMGVSQTQGTHLPLKFLLGDRYRHINFQMPELWDLADVSRIPDLFDLGKRNAIANFEDIQERFLRHTRQRFKPFTSTEGEVCDLDEYVC